MKREDLARFRRAMEKLRISLPSNIRLTEKQEALKIDEYWEIFSHYSIMAFERAVSRALRELKYFPSPVELLDRCNEEAERITHEINKDVPMLEGPRMTKEQAMTAIQKIIDRIPYGKMTDKEIEKDREAVAKRKKFLKDQARDLLERADGFLKDQARDLKGWNERTVKKIYKGVSLPKK